MNLLVHLQSTKRRPKDKQGSIGRTTCSTRANFKRIKQSSLSSRDFNRNFPRLEGYSMKSNLISSFAFISNKSSTRQFQKSIAGFCKGISGIYKAGTPLLEFPCKQGPAPPAPSPWFVQLVSGAGDSMKNTKI